MARWQSHKHHETVTTIYRGSLDRSNGGRVVPQVTTLMEIVAKQLILLGQPLELWRWEPWPIRLARTGVNAMSVTDVWLGITTTLVGATMCNPAGGIRFITADATAARIDASRYEERRAIILVNHTAPSSRSEILMNSSAVCAWSIDPGPRQIEGSPAADR